MKKIFVCLFFCYAISEFLCAQTMTDTRDGNVYKVVSIGNQTWMAENLNFVTEEGSNCYDTILSNCDKYGRLYNWHTAQHVCPSGWHLPSKSEFETLCVNSVDTSGVAFFSFSKLAYSVFSTQVGGWRYHDQGGFDGVDIVGMWWSSSEDENGFVWVLSLNTIYESAAVEPMFNVSSYSVRCIKDEN